MRNLLPLLLCFALASPALAQTLPDPAPAAAKPSGALSMLGGTGGSGKDQFLDITADQSLEWHEDESVYIARGNAVAKRGDITVKADVLMAYNRKKPDGSSEVFKLTAEGHVTISDPRHETSGDKGEYNIDDKRALLTGQSLMFKTATDTVTATESFEYLENDNKIIARGNVKAIREGRKVTSNEMIAYLTTNAKGSQDIDRMEAKGDVHITTPEDAVTCEDAVYNLSKNTATLSGKVKITRGGNQLKGDKVEADFKSGRSKLINTGTGRVSALIVGSQGKPLSANIAGGGAATPAKGKNVAPFMPVAP